MKAVAAACLSPLFAAGAVHAQPAGRDRSYHADRCALIASVRARLPRYPRNEAEQGRLAARIDAIPTSGIFDRVIGCPGFTYRDHVNFSLDNLGRSRDRRYATIAWSFQRPPIGAVGAACLFERIGRRWRRLGCLGTYGA